MTEKLIAADLASLATDNRRGARSLDDVMKALEVRRTPLPAIRGELAVVQLAQLFALRVAHVATGALALLGTLGLFSLLYRPGLPRDRFGWPSNVEDIAGSAQSMLWSGTPTFVVGIALALYATHTIAELCARRWIERRPERAARLAGKLERSARVLWPAGPLALGLLVSTVAISVGHESWITVLFASGDAGSVMVGRLRAVAIAIAALLAAAVVLGVVHRRAIATATADTALLVPARIYADRMARMWGGAVAGLGSIAAVIALHRPVAFSYYYFVETYAAPRTLGEAIDQALLWWAHDRLVMAATLAISILAAQQTARRFAARRFVRRLAAATDLPAQARRLVASVDDWSVGLAAGGAASLGVLLGITGIAAGNDLWMFLSPRLDHVVDVALHVVTPAAPLVFVVGCVAGRVGVCARPPRALRALTSCRMFELMLALSVLTVVMGEALGGRGRPLSSALQLAVSLASTLSILGLSLSYALRRRQRELTQI